MPHSIAVIGAGRIGACIAKALAHSGRFEVTLADHLPAALHGLPPHPQLHTLPLDVHDAPQLAALLGRVSAVISACSFHENRTIAEAALAAGCSYFDLTEDVETTRTVRALAEHARKGQIFMPQCGLAPGFIGILGHAVGQRFDQLHTLKLRVGALPEYPSNQLMYNLTWSTEGLINEYCNSCETLKEGRYWEAQALEGLETFSLDGVEYEAFNTSGGLGTLCETLHGQVQELNYKTIRYPGHRYLMDFLINGLRLGEAGERRAMLKKIFESSVAGTQQDLVLVVVAATGLMEGRLMQLSAAHKVYHREYLGEPWSAIQLTTALSVCSVVDLHAQGLLPACGFVRQEDVPLEQFLANEFAAVYRDSRHGQHT